MRSKVLESFDFLVDVFAKANFHRISLLVDKFNIAMEKDMLETPKGFKDMEWVSITTTIAE